MKNIIIIGATSVVAQAFARRVSPARFVLVGRSAERLSSVKSDLEARGSQASVHVIEHAMSDVCRFAVEEARKDMGSVDVVLIAQGVLTEPEEEAGEVHHVFKANTIDVANWTYASLAAFERQGYGQLAVLSSVAADRGRSANALYGASKAAVSTLIEGLRQRYARTPKIALYDLRPGPIDDTPMTDGMKKTPMFSTADRVAQGAIKALRSKPHGGVVYLPGFWRWIMFIIKALPEAIFFKTKF